MRTESDTAQIQKRRGAIPDVLRHTNGGASARRPSPVNQTVAYSEREAASARSIVSGGRARPRGSASRRPRGIQPGRSPGPAARPRLPARPQHQQNASYTKLLLASELSSRMNTIDRHGSYVTIADTHCSVDLRINQELRQWSPVMLPVGSRGLARAQAPCSISIQPRTPPR